MRLLQATSYTSDGYAGPLCKDIGIPAILFLRDSDRGPKLEEKYAERMELFSDDLPTGSDREPWTDDRENADQEQTIEILKAAYVRLWNAGARRHGFYLIVTPEFPAIGWHPLFEPWWSGGVNYRIRRMFLKCYFAPAVNLRIIEQMRTLLEDFRVPPLIFPTFNINSQPTEYIIATIRALEGINSCLLWGVSKNPGQDALAAPRLTAIREGVEG